jgi:hypothetical protein
VRAIETRYQSHLFRSRLEARWACMFDLVGWEWTYEPFDAHWYIPDFVLLGDGSVAVEVKPATTLEELERHALDVEEGLVGYWNHDYLVVGVNPTFGKAIGWHGSYLPGYAEARNGDVHWHDAPHWTGAPAFWHNCCNHALSFHHQDTYLSQPCGCNHIDAQYLGPVRAADLKALWGHAHEQSRWTR